MVNRVELSNSYISSDKLVLSSIPHSESSRLELLKIENPAELYCHEWRTGVERFFFIVFICITSEAHPGTVGLLRAVCRNRIRCFQIEFTVVIVIPFVHPAFVILVIIGTVVIVVEFFSPGPSSHSSEPSSQSSDIHHLPNPMGLCLHCHT